MRSAAIVVAFSAAFPIVSAQSALAASLEAMQGAWTMSGTTCAETFEFTGSEPKFRDRGSSLTTGIIVKGNTIYGPESTCTAAHVSESQGQYKVHMSCADSIMFSGVTVGIKVKDADHFTRIDLDYPDVSEDYQRCLPPQ
jgi:hypothetical protein